MPKINPMTLNELNSKAGRVPGLEATIRNYSDRLQDRNETIDFLVKLLGLTENYKENFDEYHYSWSEYLAARVSEDRKAVEAADAADEARARLTAPSKGESK